MPQEQMWTIMPREESRAKSTEISAALVTNVGQAVSGVTSSALLFFAGLDIDSLRPNLKTYLGRNIDLARSLKGEDLSGISNTIEEVLDGEYNHMFDALKAGLGQGVGGLHSSLYGLITGTDALIGGYLGLIQQAGINPIISRWVNDKIRPNIPDAETAWFMQRIGQLSEGQYGAYLHQNGWDDNFAGALGWAWTRQPPIEILLEMFRRKYINMDMLTERLKWYRFDDAMIANTTQLAVQYPEPYRLAEMASKALIETSEYHRVAGIFGLEPFWADTWLEAQMKFPDINTAMALLRRGEINEETFYFWMQMQQMAPEETTAVLKLKDVIPPVQDLIHFAVREAYGEHKPEEQYPAMVSIAKKMGLSEEASSWYWYAHWNRIALGQMFANYHRGNWDKTKLEYMLKIADVHPDDRADIINVAFLPPSIREMGYGWDVGAYTVDDIERFRRWGGLSPEDAKKAAGSMVAYRTETERNAVRTELMYAYGDDRIDAETFTQGLLDLNTQTEAIDYWVRRAELYKERVLKPTTDVEGRTVSGSESLTAFKLSIISEEQARALLSKLFWTEERIEIAINRAKMEIEQDKTKAETVKYRKLTVAQVTNLFNLQLINKEQMVTEFILIGYNPDDAELLAEVYTKPKAPTVAVKNYNISDAVKLYRYQIFDDDDIYNNYLLEGYDDIHAAMLTLMTKLDYDYPILAALYEKGYMSTVQLMAELKKMGLDDYHATLLIQRTQFTYSVSRLASEKELTKAEILKGAKNNVLTVTQAAELLQAIGYDQNEAYYLLAINKVVIAGDPDGYWDMRRVTEAYKKARGEKSVEIPDELIMLDAQQKQLKTKLDELKKQPEKEQEIADIVLKLGAVESRIKQIILEKGLK